MTNYQKEYLKKLATKLKEELTQQGHEISLGHVYEALSKVEGFSSWNHFSEHLKSMQDCINTQKEYRKRINSLVKVSDPACGEMIANTQAIGKGSKKYTVKFKLDDFDAEVVFNLEISANDAAEAYRLAELYMEENSIDYEVMSVVYASDSKFHITNVSSYHPDGEDNEHYSKDYDEPMTLKDLEEQMNKRR